MSALRLLALTGLALAFVSCGCGRKSTYSTPEADVTVEEKGGEQRITVQTEQGTEEWETGQRIDSQEIGIPIYPDAQVTASMRWNDAEAAEGGLTQVQLTTPDSFSAVSAFYKERLPDAELTAQIETAELKTRQFSWEEGGYQKTVIITRDASDQQTQIVLHRGPAAE